MEKFRLYVTTNKKFPFDSTSSWVARTGFERNLDLDGDYICTGATTPNIAELLPPIERGDEYRVGYLAQTIATEYWILHHVHDIDYVGVTGYRRYPLFLHDRGDQNALIHTQATPETMQAICGTHHLPVMASVLSTYDVIVPRALTFAVSVKEQYLVSQIKTIWELFIDCIGDVVPQFKRYLRWFDLTYTSLYFGPMGMTPLGLFKEYADSYAKIVALMCIRAEKPFLVIDEAARYRTDRWIGYLAERYYPFFLFASKVTSFQVPTVFLEAPVAVA
ncbi:MAG TPA: DUF4422 domain-containing protein [Acidiphilium sp.]|nr:DUF4422 domain-containing protein [Acidiphilium sp.]